GIDEKGDYFFNDESRTHTWNNDTGSVSTKDADGTQKVVRADGQISIHTPDGTHKIISPDGSTEERRMDGSWKRTSADVYSSGVPSGNSLLRTENADGSVTDVHSGPRPTDNFLLEKSKDGAYQLSETGEEKSSKFPEN